MQESLKIQAPIDAIMEVDSDQEDSEASIEHRKGVKYNYQSLLLQSPDQEDSPTFTLAQSISNLSVTKDISDLSPLMGFEMENSFRSRIRTASNIAPSEQLQDSPVVIEGDEIDSSLGQPSQTESMNSLENEDGPKFNPVNLDLVLDDQNKFKPEENLNLAINDHEDFSPAKESFWEKIGMSNKKKEQELLEKAIDGIELARRLHNEGNLEADDLRLVRDDVKQRDINQDEINKNTFTEIEQGILETEQLKRTSIFDHDTLKNLIEIEEKRAEELLEQFESFSTQVRESLDEEREAEEMMRMHLEEQEQRWDVVLQHTAEAKQILEENEYDQIEILWEKHRAEFYSQEIEFWTKLLGECMDHLKVEKEETLTNLNFGEAIAEIQHEIQDAIKMDEEFKKQATTDPRSIIPYSRTSAISGAKRFN